MIAPVKRVIELLIIVWLTGIALSLWDGINSVMYLSIVVIFPSCFVPHNLCLLYDEVLRCHLTQLHAQVQTQVGQQNRNFLNITQFFLTTLSIYCEFIFAYLLATFVILIFWSNRVETMSLETRNYNFYC